jgi:hypothetical protein
MSWNFLRNDSQGLEIAYIVPLTLFLVAGQDRCPLY